MKASRVITFPVIFIILEPFFIYWYLRDLIRSSRAKFYITRELWSASAYGIMKDRCRLYRDWLNGEPYDVVFQKEGEVKDE